MCVCFSFEDLQKCLNKLSRRLIPWQPPGEDSSCAKVEDMMLLVDSMLEHTDTENGKVVLLLLELETSIQECCLLLLKKQFVFSLL